MLCMHTCRVAVCRLDRLPVQLTHLPAQLIHDEEVSGVASQQMHRPLCKHVILPF